MLLLVNHNSWFFTGTRILFLLHYYEFSMHYIGYYLLRIQYRCPIDVSLVYKVLDRCLEVLFKLTFVLLGSYMLHSIHLRPLTPIKTEFSYGCYWTGHSSYGSYFTIMVTHWMRLAGLRGSMCLIGCSAHSLLNVLALADTTTDAGRLFHATGVR